MNEMNGPEWFFAIWSIVIAGFGLHAIFCLMCGGKCGLLCNSPDE